MCMKCGCGKKAGQKGYGKGNPKKPNKPTPSKKKPLPNATKWDSSKKKPLPRPSLNSKPQWKLLSKTNRSAKKSMPKRRAM